MGHKSIVLVAVLLGGLSAVAQSTADNKVKLNLLGGATVTLSDAPDTMWQNISTTSKRDKIVRSSSTKPTFFVVMEEQAEGSCEAGVRGLAQTNHLSLNNAPQNLLPSGWKGSSVLLAAANDNTLHLCFASNQKSIDVTASYKGNVAGADAAVVGDTLTRLATLFSKVAPGRRMKLASSGLILTVPPEQESADWTSESGGNVDVVHRKAATQLDGFVVVPLEGGKNCSQELQALHDNAGNPYEKIETPEWLPQSASPAWYRDRVERLWGCMPGPVQGFIVMVSAKVKPPKPLLNALFDAVQASTKVVPTVNKVTLTQLDDTIVSLSDAGGAKWSNNPIANQDHLLRSLPGRPVLFVRIQPAQFGKTCAAHMLKRARMDHLRLNNLPTALFPFNCMASVEARNDRVGSDLYTCFEFDNKPLSVEISYDGDIKDPDALMIPDTLKRLFPIMRCADPRDAPDQNTFVLKSTRLRITRPAGDEGEGWDTMDTVGLAGMDGLTRMKQGKMQFLYVKEEGLGCALMARVHEDDLKVAKPDFAPDGYGVWYQNQQGDIASCVTGNKRSYIIRVSGAGADMKPLMAALLDALQTQ